MNKHTHTHRGEGSAKLSKRVSLIYWLLKQFLLSLSLTGISLVCQPSEMPPKITNDTRRKIAKSMESFSSYFTFLFFICSIYPVAETFLPRCLGPVHSPSSLDAGVSCCFSVCTFLLSSCSNFHCFKRHWQAEDSQVTITVCMQSATSNSHRYLSLSRMMAHTHDFSTWKAEADHHEF